MNVIHKNLLVWILVKKKKGQYMEWKLRKEWDKMQWWEGKKVCISNLIGHFLGPLVICG